MGAKILVGYIWESRSEWVQVYVRGMKAYVSDTVNVVYISSDAPSYAELSAQHSHVFIDSRYKGISILLERVVNEEGSTYKLQIKKYVKSSYLTHKNTFLFFV